MRILVTGSRTWDDYPALAYALSKAAARAPQGTAVTIIHGGAPQGADALACRWVHEVKHIHEEAWRANWDIEGRAAGILRNRRMVAAGADLCLAFIRDNSRGATHCADEAERSGMQTKRYRYESMPRQRGDAIEAGEQR